MLALIIVRLERTIKSLIPGDIKIIETGKAVAKQTKKLLLENKIENTFYDGNDYFYCNGASESLNKILNNKFIINKL